MMPFTVDQLNHLKGQAKGLLKILQSQVVHGYPNDAQEAIIEGALREVCSQGYYIALDEVSSTPWEYAKTLANVERMNDASSEGWEFVSLAGNGNDWVIWRRRKAIADIEAKQKTD